MSATTLNTARPDWYPGQVTVNAQSDFRVVLEGKATNGGMCLFIFCCIHFQSIFLSILILQMKNQYI